MSPCPHSVTWPVLIGDSITVFAFAGLAAMLFFLCTRSLGNVSRWMPPFMFLFACVLTAVAMDYARSLYALWFDSSALDKWMPLVVGLVSMVAFCTVLISRVDILRWLGAGKSTVFKGSVSFEGTHPTKSDCNKCMVLLHDLRDKE